MTFSMVRTEVPFHHRKLVQAMFRWSLVALWMIIIFAVSALPSLRSPFEPLHDFILRKIAHVTEYAILTALLIGALRLHVSRNTHPLVIAAVVAVFYAFSDEWHQSFVPGREGSLRDVGIDMMGIGVALWVAAWKPPITQPAVMLVVYDGACAFCRRSIAAIRRRDRYGHFAYLPRQTPGIEAQYPQLAIGDFDEGMRTIEPDGTMHIGADAIYQIASRLPYFRRFSWLYHLPLARHVTRHVYAWVATNRMKLSQYCADSSCELPSADAKEKIKNGMRPFYRHRSKLFVSIFILLVLGAHVLPVLQELHGHRQTFWPIMAWGMYRYAHDGTKPIQTSVRRLIGVTARGKEFAITPEQSGLFHFGFVRLYLRPIVNGDASAVQGLADRVNIGRDDPVIALRLEDETHTLTPDGVVKTPTVVRHYRINF